jgi:hypothetical protein
MIEFCLFPGVVLTLAYLLVKLVGRKYGTSVVGCDSTLKSSRKYFGKVTLFRPHVRMGDARANANGFLASSCWSWVRSSVGGCFMKVWRCFACWKSGFIRGESGKSDRGWASDSIGKVSFPPRGVCVVLLV